MTPADAHALEFLAARARLADHQARHLADWWHAAAASTEPFAAFIARQGLVSDSTARIIEQVANGNLTGSMAAALLDPEELSNARRRLPEVATLEQKPDATVTFLASGETVRDLKVPRDDDRPRVGMKLGKYLLTEWIGDGASGSVFRAMHPSLQIPVAVKVPHSSGSEPERHHRLETEARLLARLNHPNIVRVYDFEAHGRHPFVVMEHVNGPTLGELIERCGRVQPGPAVTICRQLAGALAAAHRLGVVHRDVKPANVLMTRTGEVKLADLGLAMLRGSGVVSDGSRVGTALYIAPELIGSPQAAGEQSDLYSLGATMFHAITGVPPFRAGKAWEIIGQHARAARPNARDFAPGIPVDLANLIKRMIAVAPNERPRGFAALLDEPALNRDYGAPQSWNRSTPLWQRLFGRLRRTQSRLQYT